MDNLKDLLGEELFNQVKEKLGDTKVMIDDGNFIPKSRFDEVNNQIKDYKQQLEERDNQLEELKKQSGDSQELQQKIQELQQQNEQVKTEYEQKLQEQQFDHTLENSLKDAKARNPRAVKALLDTDTLKLDNEGNIKGLDEQLKNLQENEPYLFETEEGGGEEQGGKPKFSNDQHKKGGESTQEAWLEAFKPPQMGSQGGGNE